MVWLVASASDGVGGDPDEVPAAAFSLTAFVAPAVSVGVEASNSSTSLTAIVKAWSACEPSLEEARTVMSSEAALSRLICEPSRTVTTPVWR